jgi:hypothetical protein
MGCEAAVNRNKEDRRNVMTPPVHLYHQTTSINGQRR